MMKKVSIVVPVYNTEKYVRDCLESLVNQSLEDIEIIMVNDGSTDGSLTILKEYEHKYPDKIRIVDKENGGMSDARNAGLKHATGEYIGFVDGDDYVKETTYATLYEKAKSKDFDIVACNINYVYPDHEKKAYCHYTHDLWDKDEIRKSLTTFYPSVCNKIFHRRLFEESKLTFTKDVWFEDVEFNYCIYPYIKSIGVVDEFFYQYIQREGSITKVFNERLFDYLKNWKSILSYYKKHGFYQTYEKELEYSCVRYLYATFVKATANYLEKDMYLDAVKQAKQMVISTFPTYRKNLYFYKNGMKGYYLLTFNRFTIAMVYRFINR